MIYTIERKLINFEAWAGAVYTKQALIERDDIEAIEDLLKDCNGETAMTETEINDFLWFETDYIAEYLGFADWEDYTKNKKPRYFIKSNPYKNE